MSALESRDGEVFLSEILRVDFLNSIFVAFILEAFMMQLELIKSTNDDPLALKLDAIQKQDEWKDRRNYRLSHGIKVCSRVGCA